MVERTRRLLGEPCLETTTSFVTVSRKRFFEFCALLADRITEIQPRSRLPSAQKQASFARSENHQRGGRRTLARFAQTSSGLISRATDNSRENKFSKNNRGLSRIRPPAYHTATCKLYRFSDSGQVFQSAGVRDDLPNFPRLAPSHLQATTYGKRPANCEFLRTFESADCGSWTVTRQHVTLLPRGRYFPMQESKI